MPATLSDPAVLRREVARFQRPALFEGLSQIVTSFGGFFATCAAMYVLAGVSYWLVPLLAPLAGGFLMRIFVIQHDCGHGSFLRSRRANAAIGFACSVLTMTPFPSWRRQHAGHHNTWNDLDHRDVADMYSACITVAEYRALSPRQRIWYRITRNPIFANVILPPFIFTLLYRTPFDLPRSWGYERRAIHFTSLGLVAGLGGVGLLLGFADVLVVQLSAVAFAAIVGSWMFSVQHRADRTHWRRHEDWNRVSASLDGTTYFRLPAVLNWFTGNIGFHHVHHLNPAVPNYRLRACHHRIAPFHDVQTLSLRSAFRALRFTLWDEEARAMTTFRAAGHQTAQHP
jgi:omega-6 fatty acid desaturase (delta-12 desaturase)